MCKSWDEEKVCFLTSLPEELALSCLARVSRSDLVALPLVSKTYRSLVSSPELYKIRSQLGYTCFYICLIREDNSPLRWFMLSREKTTNRLMTPIPSFPSTFRTGSSLVSLDWGIYVIGGTINEEPTSDVSLLDCRTHTWRHVPGMRVARSFPGTGVVGGKIYVFGGWKNKGDASNWGEIFDPKTQTWEFLVPMPGDSRKPNGRFIFESLVIEDKVYAQCHRNETFFYSPVKGEWERHNYVVKPRIHSYSYVTPDKLLYGCDSYGNVYWSDHLDFEWKQVKGLEALLMIFPHHDDVINLPLRDRCKKSFSRIRIFGVNIMLFWFKPNFSDKNVDLWCAEISFERRHEKDEVWGTIEWSQVVATLDLDPFATVKVLCSASVNV